VSTLSRGSQLGILGFSDSISIRSSALGQVSYSNVSIQVILDDGECGVAEQTWYSAPSLVVEVSDSLPKILTRFSEASQKSAVSTPSSVILISAYDYGISFS
jgi:hypothetical protein